MPDGVLFGSSNAHKTLRRILVEDQKLDAVVSLPGGVFKPYAGVSTAILLFTKTNSGGTDHVWFYDVEADGCRLDDKRTELLPPRTSSAPCPRPRSPPDEHAKNNLPDILARWRTLGFGVPASAGTPYTAAGRRLFANSAPLHESSGWKPVLSRPSRGEAGDASDAATGRLGRGGAGLIRGEKGFHA